MKKRREVLRRGSILTLGVLVLGLSTTTAVGQVSAADSNSTAKTYGIDAFGVDYSKGILFRNANFNSTVSPMSVTLPSGGTATTIGSSSETVSC